jgi:hypothetical protein
MEIYVGETKKDKDSAFMLYFRSNNSIVQFIVCSSRFGLVPKEEAVLHAYKVTESFHQAMKWPPGYRYRDQRYYIYVPFIQST